MPTMNIIEAVRDALRIEMRRDQRVVVLGEDVGKFGGVFRATSGLYDEFGADRVIDTPLAEAGIIGTAIGMALYGMRPVPEIQFGDFIFPAFDQIVNELAKFRYRSGGQYPCPVVIRTPVGGGIRGGHYHSQSPEALFIHTPGLKVVAPSNPYDAKGLLLACMRQNDPVLFMEPKRIYRASRGEVPEGEYTLEIGKAAVVREGTHCTLLAYSGMVSIAEEAAKKGEAEGVSIEVVDLRTLMPYDIDTILASVKKGIYAASFGGGQVDITSGKFVFQCTEAYLIENGKLGQPVKGAMLIGNGPDALTRVPMVGNDMALDPGVGTCGKNGQGVPVGVGQPTLRIDRITVGGTQAA